MKIFPHFPQCASDKLSLREKCSNTEFLLVRIFLYSLRIQDNTDLKKLRIHAVCILCQSKRLLRKKMFVMEENKHVKYSKLTLDHVNPFQVNVPFLSLREKLFRVILIRIQSECGKYGPE